MKVAIGKEFCFVLFFLGKEYFIHRRANTDVQDTFLKKADFEFMRQKEDGRDPLLGEDWDVETRKVMGTKKM